VRLDEKIQGHGFGLAITTDIVNDYNGSISFKHSNELGGFKADITLPLYQL
jgi:two-component system sensor histidine kinase PhoQ